METKDIIIFAVALTAALGYRLYKEYRKKQEKAGQAPAKKEDNSFSSQSGADDYEPYSGGRK
ncbi:MAG: hypothetical protein MUE74_02595 [Bacteroidales bacterium]|nr:hypothetical protein [Bacteroidales bacterium]